MKEQVQNVSETITTRGRFNRKLKLLLTRLSTQVERLLKVMNIDECVNLSPCKNGATCIDLFDKFQCICPVHFEVFFL